MAKLQKKKSSFWGVRGAAHQILWKNNLEKSIILNYLGEYLELSRLLGAILVSLMKYQNIIQHLGSNLCQTVLKPQIVRSALVAGNRESDTHASGICN